MSLADFRTLGRSGLIVSPLALGTMTFGTPRWGSPDAVSRAIFDAYVDAGGNFIDTADVYSKGRSETLVGEYIAERRSPRVSARQGATGDGRLSGPNPFQSQKSARVAAFGSSPGRRPGLTFPLIELPRPCHGQ